MMVRANRNMLCASLLLGLIALSTRGDQPESVPRSGDAGRPEIEYNRDVRPILSENCFRCHGLDEKARKAGLRLDDRDLAVRPTERGGTAIVPGKPDESALVKRIFSTDQSFVMPPPESNKKLTAAERELLRRWIEQGARYESHWSFVAPKRPALPTIRDTAWPRNPIDQFILARLEMEGLRPSPEADRATLIRRVTFDLTGLPATPAEVDAFLADTRPDAYEKVVDRLLRSPRYGERMAVDWLDAARFADTHGYHIDSGRDMTRWRQWVIDAYNDNMPFDQFTVEQLAGDLLVEEPDPDVTLNRKIASGFNRNHMINYEGGAIPEEYHVAYIVDRVNTTGTVWLGLTIGCAQCHDHKYDPISQKEYYQLYAFFHNVPENGLDGRLGNAAPVLQFPTADQRRRLDQLATSVRDLEQRLTRPDLEVDAAQAAWEQSEIATAKIEWTPLNLVEFESAGGATLTKLDDQSILAAGNNPENDRYTIAATTESPEITAIRLDSLPDDSLAARGPGRSSNGNVVLTDVRAVLRRPGDASEGASVRWKAASADFSQQDFPVSGAIDDKPETGWSIFPEVGKPHAAVFEFAEPVSRIGPPVARNGDGVVDDKADVATIVITLDFQSQFARHQLGRFRLSVTSAKQPHESSRPPANIRDVLALAPESRNEQQKAELQKFYRTSVSPVLKQVNEELIKLRKEQAELEKHIPSTMVMQEMDKPRETFMLERGQYDKKVEKVDAGVPASLGPLPEGAPANRLGLARWLVDPAQPLVARVIVNRYWHMYFGGGIVKTAEDLGSQGEWPSHPELLDWLAREFVESGWDIKHMQRLIVTSATYQQSSFVTPALVARDPENRLLTRGPRLRLQVEFIRDQALAISGLLNGQIGGGSVSPYQPPGIWEELAYRADGKNFSAQEYVQSHGKDLYRRTMYTFIKRTAPPPSLVTFDAPDRETCTVRRPRTNTPLQALVLMNDPTYVECARQLAERMMTETGASASREDRIIWAFRLATARPPTLDELKLLRRLFKAQLDVYRKDPHAASKLLSVGESPRNESLDPAEHAAWTIVANTILNLDETMTKG